MNIYFVLFYTVSRLPRQRTRMDLGDSMLISSAATERAVAECVIVEVEFNNGNWWEIPNPQVAGAFVDGWNEVGYTFDWGTARPGSWSPDGKETSINRYKINFQTMKQQNIDNGRTRNIRVMRAATR